MSFCNWCNLETESEDTCEWCKRPVRRSVGVYSSFGSPVSMLREDDAEPGDRVTAIFGVMIGVAFVALLLFVGISYRGGGKNSDPMNQIAESEKTWTAERAAAPVAAAPPTPVAANAPRVPTASGPVRRTPQPTAGMSTSTQQASSSSVWQKDGMAGFESGQRATGINLEHAKLSVAREPGGTYAVSGEVKLSNLSGGRVSEIALKIVASSGSVPLDIGEQDSVIGSGASRTYRVAARGVPTDIVNDPASYIEVEGVSAEGPYKDRIALR